MGGFQNQGPLLGPLNTRRRIYTKEPKRDHHFDNHPCNPRPLVRISWSLFGGTHRNYRVPLRVFGVTQCRFEVVVMTV